MSSPSQLSDAKRALLERMLRGEAAAAADDVAVTPRHADAVPPIAAEQRQVWMHAAMAPGVPLYNEPVTIHRRGAFDPAAFEQSFNEILRRHEIWRTSFRLVDGEIVQIVQPQLRISLPVVDLTHLAPAARDAEARRLAGLDACTPIELDSAPLFRTTLVKLAHDDHRLYLTLHHLIFDGVSLYRVMLPELATLYDAVVNGRRPPLAEPTLQYGDYAIWREQHAATDAVARQMDYWRRELAGPLPVLDLPTDRPRPAVPTHGGSIEHFALPDGLTERLSALGRAEGATLYAILLAGFSALLFRYSGQDDIIIGGVTDTRRRAELEPVMGYFLNSLALRTRPSGALAFRDHLRQVRNAALGALGASDVPFDHIVRALQPKRDLSRHPLFQVLFLIEPPLGQMPDGWDLTQMDVIACVSKFDLFLDFEERPTGLIARLFYSTDLFDAPTIRRLIAHLIAILDAVAADPACRLADLPLMSADETRQLLVDWNATRQGCPQTTVHALFEAQARRTPDAPAATSAGTTWSYRELDRRADRLAKRLAAAGVGRETLVALCIERSLDMLAGLLAILKAGGAYLPLDPDFPPARLALILDDARPALLLTQRARLAQLLDGDVPVLLCDDHADLAVDALPTAGRAAGPDDLAYVLYTSGSTGRPKGVEVPHGAVVNLLTAMQRAPGFAARDALLAVTTVSFDIAALELFLPLVSGGRVILAGRAATRDPRLLARAVDASGCTVMQATPATWRGLIEAGWLGVGRPKILCGGEALTRDLADQLLARGASVWNLYGPTETTIWSAAHKVEREVGRGMSSVTGSVPIGRPIANTTFYILDRHDRPVPIGVPGELCIGGAGVARGYRNRAELTAQRFVTCAIAQDERVSGERVYRTGDIARWRADGTVEWLGRADDQVKIRGYRIEIGEVEAALARHPRLAAAAVRTWPDPSGGAMLVAYGVERAGGGGGEPLGITELRRFLGGTLPDAMIPSRYVALPALPMTPNAKVDRKALPAPEAAVQAGTVAPRDDRERTLAQIWQEALGVARVGVQDDIFELGGHSLLIAKLLARVEIAFGVRLPLAAIFQAPTVERMAKLIGTTSTPPQLSRTIVIQPKGTRPPLLWLNPEPSFRRLADVMAPEQPFVAVQLDPDDVRDLTYPAPLSAIAQPYVRAIRAFQPRGPYYLGGWCIWGPVGYEIAQQLRAAGEAVGLLVLLHAVNPVQYRATGALRVFADKLRFRLGEAMSQSARARRRRVAGRSNAALQAAARPPAPVGPGEPPSFAHILQHAAENYVPQPYDGPVALFQPDSRPGFMDYRPGWEPVVADLTTFEIPATHYSLLLDETTLNEMAQTMKFCLLRAQSRVAPRQASAAA